MIRNIDSPFIGYDITFTQRNIRQMIREARSVVSQHSSPSPKHNSSSILHPNQQEKELCTTKRKLYSLKSYRGKGSLKKKKSSHFSQAKKQKQLQKNEIQQPNIQRTKLYKNLVEALHTQQIKGIEEGLVRTKTKLKQKLKTEAQTNEIHWKKSLTKNKNKESLQALVVVLDPKRGIEKHKKQRKKTEELYYGYTPWETSIDQTIYEDNILN